MTAGDDIAAAPAIATPLTTTFLDVTEFGRMFAAAGAGETIVYATGNLALDRRKSVDLLRTQQLAFILAADGHAYLKQRRLAEDRYSYSIEKASAGRPRSLFPQRDERNPKQGRVLT
jgi:hypothetical protein